MHHIRIAMVVEKHTVWLQCWYCASEWSNSNGSKIKSLICKRLNWLMTQSA